MADWLWLERYPLRGLLHLGCTLGKSFRYAALHLLGREIGVVSPQETSCEQRDLSDGRGDRPKRSVTGNVDVRDVRRIA